MARLTNKQLEVLAASIVDKLEEDFELKKKNYKESQEYKDKYEKLLKNPQYKKMEQLLNAIEEADKLRNEKINEAKDLYRKVFDVSYVSYPSKDYLDRFKRQFLNIRNIHFDREKLMNKVMADILLGDSTDAKEIFEKLTEKYDKKGTDTEIFSK